LYAICQELNHQFLSHSERRIRGKKLLPKFGQSRFVQIWQR
jgi:hypothetical protein